MQRYTKFTSEIVSFVRENVSTSTDKQIASMIKDRFGVDTNDVAIANLKARNGIRSGVKRGTFPKGHVPANKGKKQTEFMDPKSIKKTKATRFKKGNISPNNVPIGTERINKQGYIEIKVQDGNLNKNWKLKHRWIWEQHHEPIPDKHQVIFLNGDRQDVRIENLALTTYGEGAVMNKLGFFDNNPEITEAGILIARLIKKTSDKSMKKKEVKTNDQ